MNHYAVTVVRHQFKSLPRCRSGCSFVFTDLDQVQFCTRPRSPLTHVIAEKLDSARTKYADTVTSVGAFSRFPQASIMTAKQATHITIMTTALRHRTRWSMRPIFGEIGRAPMKSRPAMAVKRRPAMSPRAPVATPKSHASVLSVWQVKM